MGSFSLAHWLIVIVVLLLVFGPKRLSEAGKGLGQGIRNFKKGLEGDEKAKDEEEEELEEEAPKKKLEKKRESEPKRLKAAADEEEDEEPAPRPRKKVRRA